MPKLSKKQLEEEKETKNICGQCCNFPGDSVNLPCYAAFKRCPFEGKIFYSTCPEDLNNGKGCPDYWD